MAGADLAYLCHGAKLAALEAADFSDRARLGVAHFGAALAELSPRR
jgi:hypothetical protein